MKFYKMVIPLLIVILVAPPAACCASGKKVTAGGPVTGLFEPAVTPLTWRDLPESGGRLGTEAFMNGRSTDDVRGSAINLPGFSDIERANLERGMRLPSFNVPGGGCSDICSDR
jgi:hypothetical protein